MTEIIPTSSVLILFLIVIRKLLRRRLHPTLQYALWLLVAARLLIPGTLFSAPVSLVETAQDLRTTLVSETTPAPELPLSPDAALSGAFAAASPGEQPDGFPLHPLDLKTFWMAGMGLTGAVLLTSNLIFTRRLRRTRVPLPQYTCSAPVYLAADLPSPCLFGLLRPSIYVNQSSLQPGPIAHILAHEEAHLRHGDHLWALLRAVCLVVHWYNPLVWWAAILSRRDCELSCDAAAIRRLGESQRIAYGETLLTMALPRSTSLLGIATTMTTGKRTLADRITFIATRPRMRFISAVLALAAACGAVVFCFGGGAQAVEALPPPIPEAPAPSPAPPVIPEPTAQEEEIVYTHPFFSLHLPSTDYLAIETATGVTISCDNETLRLLTQPSQWLETNPTPAQPLATFDTNGTAQTYLLETDSPDAPLTRQIASSFRLHITPDHISRLVHDSLAEDTARAIPYLPYLSWLNYRSLYGEDGLLELLSALRLAADTGDLTWEQYHDLLSVLPDAAIDGAYAAMYGDMLQRLHDRQPRQFASVLLSPYISPTERESALLWTGLTEQRLTAEAS